MRYESLFVRTQGDWHVGRPPDPRAIVVAERNGVDITGLRARQVKPDDFRRFDHIVALDLQNLANLRRMSGNILVADGGLAAFIDPACYYGHAEVDLAMLTLFDSPPRDFWAAYGPLKPGSDARRPVYQLFPALVHLRLFGASYAATVDRLLVQLGA